MSLEFQARLQLAKARKAKRKAKAHRLRKAREAPTSDGRTLIVPPRATKSGEENKLQRELNAAIREFYGPVCISCGKIGLTVRIPKIGGNWEAGHLFAVGPYPALRFHPLNISSQCSYCNGYLRGNHAAYAAAFIRRYGLESFQALDAIKGEPRKFTIADLIDLRTALSEGLHIYVIRYYQLTQWKVLTELQSRE